MTANLGFASAVAEFGMLLRGSPHAGRASYGAVIDRARRYAGDDRTATAPSSSAWSSARPSWPTAATRAVAAGRDPRTCGRYASYWQRFGIPSPHVSDHTRIGRSLVITGELECSEDLLIEGRVNGHLMVA